MKFEMRQLTGVLTHTARRIQRDQFGPGYSRLRQLEGAYLRPHRRTILAALAAMLLQSVLVLPLPWLQGWVIDQLGNGGQFDSRLTIAIVATLICLLGRMGLGWLSSSLMNQVSLQFVRTLTDSLHRKLQRLSLSYFDGQETGQLMARLTNDVGTLLIFLSGSSLALVADLVLATGILVVLLILCWPLAIVSF